MSLLADSMQCVRVRPAQPNDLSQLVHLCREHAEYERADIDGPHAGLLSAALFDPMPRLRAWVAASAEEELLGYATATIDFSTWSTRSFMHLDCLFVRAPARGRGVGRLLTDAAFSAARALGVAQVQRQTPVWNTDAQRFYEHLGANGLPKTRFVLELR